MKIYKRRLASRCFASNYFASDETGGENLCSFCLFWEIECFFVKRFLFWRFHFTSLRIEAHRQNLRCHGTSLGRREWLLWKRKHLKLPIWPNKEPINVHIFQNNVFFSPLKGDFSQLNHPNFDHFKWKMNTIQNEHPQPNWQPHKTFRFENCVSVFVAEIRFRL